MDVLLWYLAALRFGWFPSIRAAQLGWLSLAPALAVGAITLTVLVLRGPLKSPR